MPVNLNRSVSDGSGYQSRGPFQRSHSTPNSNSSRQVAVSEVTRSKLNQINNKKNSDTSDSRDDPSELTLPPHPTSGLQTPSKWTAKPRQLRDIEEEPSPHDRISWNTDLASLERSASQGTPLRNRKRAASSSPTQSPYANKRDGESTTFRKLAAASKVAADPTLELWDRYALHVEGLTSGSPLAQPISELLVSSSPQPQRESASNGSGSRGLDQTLRKTLAKASSTKRRRMAEPARASLLRQDSNASTSSNSLVDVFLSNAWSGSLFSSRAGSERQSISRDAPAPAPRDSLSRSKSETATGFLRRDMSPASSFPSIREDSPVDSTSVSVPEAIPEKEPPVAVGNPINKSAPTIAVVPSRPSAPGRPTASAINMNEFANLDEDMFDDDLDDSLLLDLADNTPIVSAPLNLPPKLAHVSTSKPTTPTLHRHVTASAAVPISSATTQPLTNHNTDGFGDEYGEDDFDDEELNQLYDSTQKPAVDQDHGQTAPQQANTASGGDEFDEFGDFGDLEDLDLDAEFATASQAGGPHTSVRTHNNHQGYDQAGQVEYIGAYGVEEQYDYAGEQDQYENQYQRHHHNEGHNGYQQVYHGNVAQNGQGQFHNQYQNQYQQVPPQRQSGYVQSTANGFRAAHGYPGQYQARPHQQPAVPRHQPHQPQSRQNYRRY